MESREQAFETWVRRHQERFSNLKPVPGLGAQAIKIVQALSRTIGQLAFLIDEDDRDRRFRSYERAMEELTEALNKIAGGAND